MNMNLHRVLSCVVLACTVLALLVACGGEVVVNVNPVAVAGDLVTVDVGETVSLDASASTDADGDTLDYYWTFESRPEGSTASFVDDRAVSTTFMPDKAGIYRLGLVVNDGSRDSEKVYQTVHALNYLVSFYADSGRTLLETVQVGPPGYRLPFVPAEAGNPGYLFVGWFTLAGGEGERVSQGMVIDENLMVYEHWSEFAYTITFTAQDATTGPAPATMLVSSPTNSLAGLPTSPSRSGYLFGGWYTAPNGGGTPVTPETVFIADTEVFAKWDNYSYTVSFNSGDASTPANPTSIEVASPATSCASLPAAPSRTNYLFDGWYTQPDGQGDAFTTATPVSGDLTVHAKWIDYDYTVSFDSAGATTAATPATLVLGSTQTSLGSLPSEPVKTGYLFGGWYTEPDGGGTRVTANSRFSANTTVYAKWDFYRYLVRFSAPDATTPANPATVEVASPATSCASLPVAPSRTNYLFDGWYTQPDGQGTAFTTATPISGDLTVHAKWIDYNYTVSFDSAGATTAATPAILVLGSTQTNLGSLPAAPAKTGYLFGGWYTEPNGGGTVVTANSRFSANTTVYAKWENYSYTVSFNSGEATSPANPASIEVASPATSCPSLPAAPSRTNYIFDGWYTQPNGQGTAITTSSPVTGNLTVHAKWIDYNYMVTFDSAGATTAATPATLVVGSTQTSLGTLPAAPVKTGYLFGGWYTEPNGAGTPVTASSAFTRDTTVYAKWNPYRYLVSFSAPDASSPANPSTVEVASPATTCASLPAAPSRANYLFDGWYTGPDRSGTAFTASTVVTADMTVHAAWRDFEYTVTFDSAGATTAATPATLVVGSTQTSLGSLPAAPVKTGYLFGGWYTEPDGGGSRVTANSSFGSDITVYAKWDSYRYLVVFNDSGATVPVGTASMAVESPARFVGSLPAAPAKSGYAFGGWFTEPNGAGEPFTATTLVSDTLAVYANWTSYSWTVTFTAPDATTAPGFASKTVASPQTLLGALPAAPARTGYLFGGWYTGPDGSGTAVTATSALSGNTELHAKWNSYTYTVAFDSAGADSPASPASKTVASPATTAGTLPAAPVRTGFTFSGWYTAPNGGGTQFTAASPVSGDTTVYAKWLPNSAVSVEVSIPGSGPVTILNDNPVVSKGSTVNVRVAQTGYERYQWYLDGVLQGAAGSTISINTSAMEAGVHSLMVVIADSQGAGASASCRFTIEN